MRSSKAAGFTFTEAMISVAILGIIATAAGYSLRTSQQRDQLRSASRVVASDLRSAQARAIAAQNIKFCTIGGQKTVCESSEVGCADVCTAIAPAGIGVHLTKDGTAYTMYAKYDPNTTDWRQVGAREVVLNRDLGISGAPNVKISSMYSPTVPDYASMDVAFQRQNGGMLIDACPACSNQSRLNIVLTHTVSNVSITVSLNKITGRISVEE